MEGRQVLESDKPDLQCQAPPSAGQVSNLGSPRAPLLGDTVEKTVTPGTGRPEDQVGDNLCPVTGPAPGTWLAPNKWEWFPAFSWG